jgi:hypothetical protein
MNACFQRKKKISNKQDEIKAILGEPPKKSEVVAGNA